MAKKRYYSDKAEGRRGILSSDKSAISNLPPDVHYYEVPNPRYGNDVMSVDGSTRTIYDQVAADGKGLMSNKSKWRF